MIGFFKKLMTFLPLQGAPLSNKLQVIKEGAFTLPVTSTPTVVGETITHNLGYVPMVQGFIKRPNDTVWENLPFTLFSVPDMLTQLDIQATESVVTFSLEVASSSVSSTGDWQIKYFLLRSQGK